MLPVFRSMAVCEEQDKENKNKYRQGKRSWQVWKEIQYSVQIKSLHFMAWLHSNGIGRHAAEQTVCPQWIMAMLLFKLN